MSLRGLDDNAVTQAHQAALVEAGGWFLLNYVNRDTVCVLDAGKGGVNEVRDAVGRYEEKSPLFGLLHYRRKKIILKYVPEGTSRLLQVRLAVQFQSILDTFTPHDTVFPFTAADELSESTLGLSTMKLQDGGSLTSSTSSLHQRRLNEITETAEESVTTTTTSTLSKMTAKETPEKNQPEHMAALPASALRAKALLEERRLRDSREEMETEINTDFNDRIVESHPRPRTETLYEGPVSPLTDIGDASRSYIPLTRPDTSRIMPVDPRLRPSFDISIPDLDSDSDDDLRRPVPKDFPAVAYSNHLSAAESNNISRWTDDVAASTKQKRAPHPHVDTNIRPETSGTSESASPSRPVANLPVSVRVSSRIHSQASRPGSRQSTRSVPVKFMPSAALYSPLSTMTPTPPQTPSNRHQNRPSLSQTTPTSDIGPVVTAEKIRLMKALQMRKRNQLLAQQSTSTTPATFVQSASIDSLHSNTSELDATRSLSASSSTTNAELVRPRHNLGSVNESGKTSPISAPTTSDHQSTKPSSLSTISMRKTSQTSLSSDTNSSTTPKADSDAKRQPAASNDSPIIANNESVMISVASISGLVQSPTETTQDHVGETLSKLEGFNTEPNVEKKIEVSDPEQHNVQDAPNNSLQPPVGVKKRQAFEGSIRIPPSTDVSDVSEDESFLEELQNATVLEAKPVSVNRAPVTPVLAKTPTKDTYSLSTNITTPNSTSNESQRSTPDRRRTASRAGSARSISATLPQWPPPQVEPVPALPKQKPALGSNISKRIKALEGLSQRESSNTSGISKDSVLRPVVTPLLKRSVFTQPPNSTTVTETPVPRAISSPIRIEPEESNDKPNARPLVQRPGTSTEVFTPAHKGETVSVTARIVRDPVKPKSAHATSDTVRRMHRSPLIVEYETFHDTNSRPSVPRGLTTMSSDSVMSAPTAERRRFSFSSHKSIARPLSSAESKPHSFSISSPRKRLSKSPSETSSVVEDKRSSRTSRMLRRLSGLGKMRTKDLRASPSRDLSSPQPNTIQEHTEMDPSSIHHVVDIGEVNVQFPEELLWKRRFLRVDDEGYLIFASPLNDQNTNGRSRKIHLDEFVKPCLPDLEHEEMAWSIRLGLKDGRIVQCACESRGAQKTTLKMLTDAHWAYHQLYHQ